MDIEISKKFYTKKAIEETIDDYAEALKITLQENSSGFCLTFECDENDKEFITNEFLNYVLFKQKSFRGEI